MIAALLRIVAGLVARLPDAALERLGLVLGGLAALAGVRRRVALANLELAFPGEDAAFRRRTLRAFYRHLGLLVAEFLRAPALRPERLDELVDIEGLPAFEAARGEGRGVIVAIAHFGNFELLGSLWSRRGLPVTAVTKRLPANPFNVFWQEQRRRAGLREVPDSGSLRDILRVLRAGEVLAVMIDQNTIPRRAVFAPFFGKLAATTPAPAVLAERTGAPVFLVLMHRLPRLRHRVTIEPVPFERTGDAEADRLAFTTQLNLALERRVRQEPDLWWWVHRRWKTRPEGERPGAAPSASAA